MKPPADETRAAGGIRSVLVALTRARSAMGVRRSATALANVNQVRGFDCPGCAWPDPGERAAIEFCENGAKAVAHEATRARIGADFFAKHSIRDLLARSDHWLERQGRLTEPMWKPAGATHYEPIAWDAAFERIAARLRELSHPDEAIFYTSGRTSNEAAFLYQLFVRAFGTNNLPDCSNLCHESSGTGLNEVIGTGKGTVSLEDFSHADLIFIVGQNPGTNHPRMLGTLMAAKRRGCRIISINPLKELGLVRFAHPQKPLSLLRGGEAISDLYLQVRVGGDIALLKGIMREVLAADEREPGGVIDWDFVRRHTEGFDSLKELLLRPTWEEIEAESGISRAQMRAVADLYAASDRVIACWAMGLTQHRHGVANVQEIVNLLLLRGNVGKPGAGPCPVRGHSNVQGDRTMGITEKPNAAFLERLAREFSFAPPSRTGLDVVQSIEALLAGGAKFFCGLGGNFAVATPDRDRTTLALRRCDLTVQISTKLNRSHLVCGTEALILPTLGRTEIDEQASGRQFVSVEDSMSAVHRSEGVLPPASAKLRSEPAIVAGMAQAVLGDRTLIPWLRFTEDYDRIRDRIANVVPGFEDFNRRVRNPGGFVLPSGARSRHFETASGKACFTAVALPGDALRPGQFRMTTIRSHDQFNTTVYGLDDRYRGIYGDRNVVLLRPEDIESQGLREGDRVDVTSHFEGETRSLSRVRVVGYDLPSRCAAMYFPEANPLVSLGNHADQSRTPAYKNFVVTFARSASAGP